MDFDGKRSGQIPAFGDWDKANELPITQYFESARQAGLVRHAATHRTATYQSQRDPYMTNARGSCGGYPVDPYAADFQKPSVRFVTFPPRKITGGAAAVNNGQNNRRRRCGCPPHVKEQKQQQQLQQQRRIKQHGLVPVQVNVYGVVDVKQQLPTPRTKSQQLYYNHHHHNHNNSNNSNSGDQNQKKQMFPKHTVSAPKHTVSATSSVNAKPVDEDLYKIPPELLLHHHNSKRKKMLGFFSKCLVPPCKA